MHIMAKPQSASSKRLIIDQKPSKNILVFSETIKNKCVTATRWDPMD